MDVDRATGTITASATIPGEERIHDGRSTTTMNSERATLRVIGVTVVRKDGIVNVYRSAVVINRGISAIVRDNAVIKGEGLLPVIIDRGPVAGGGVPTHGAGVQRQRPFVIDSATAT